MDAKDSTGVAALPPIGGWSSVREESAAPSHRAARAGSSCRSNRVVHAQLELDARREVVTQRPIIGMDGVLHGPDSPATEMGHTQ